MLSYCLKCRKFMENKNPRVKKTKNGRIMLISTQKNSRFIKEQQANGFVSIIEIKTPQCEVLILGPILFWGDRKNTIINKVL